VEQEESRMVSPMNAFIYLLIYTVGIRGFLLLMVSEGE
jgi:hypothetical protein